MHMRDTRHKMRDARCGYGRRRTLPRFENSRNVEMTTQHMLGGLGRRLLVLDGDLGMGVCFWNREALICQERHVTRNASAASWYLLASPEKSFRQSCAIMNVSGHGVFENLGSL